jgi:cob(I)alamin adenosyltransferase
LFDVGGDLCWPNQPNEKPGQVLRVRPEQVTRLENAIDQYNELLQPLKSFILPGGQLAAAWCHLARTVCRRAERELATLMQQEATNPQVLIYLNRLSDLLFVLARTLNHQGKDDILWEPGKMVP